MAKMALGRGISAIFDDIESAYKEDLKSEENVVSLNIDEIKPNPYQPRKTFDEKGLEELSESIKKYGLIQPIVVLQKKDSFVLIAGERRLRASKLAGFTQIKSILVDLEQGKLRELALIENIQRQDLNPIDLANSYKELLQTHNITQEDLSLIIHKSRAQISNTMRLLTLSEKTQKSVVDGHISQGHAKILVGLDQTAESTVLNSILGQKLNVRQTEDLVKSLKNSIANRTTAKKIDKIDGLDELNNILKNSNFSHKIKNNTLTINFNSKDEVLELLRCLNS
ncbi:MAG: Chromosome (plasmid) partitioning protein ParB [uncultured Campylobacterales bacterium]|uniref:Chromosome (Plasmid) partitioning protein ParB n=1 Tax=uncultured Campylobacterales bacterium TaxID=352960 RepID=A0A6S6S136_9BACT|nr:MAG: Chromosome (plasmid) partitioning protein ParB [uncultured Campylobacterales bacterium]